MKILNISPATIESVEAFPEKNLDYQIKWCPEITITPWFGKPRKAEDGYYFQSPFGGKVEHNVEKYAFVKQGIVYQKPYMQITFTSGQKSKCEYFDTYEEAMEAAYKISSCFIESKIQ